jgi:hypothetical protein
MMWQMGTTQFELEPIYVVGTHEDFMTAMTNKLEELRDSGAGRTLVLTNVSHALAIAANGEMHWSALICGSVTTR